MRALAKLCALLVFITLPALADDRDTLLQQRLKAHIEFLASEPIPYTRGHRQNQAAD